MELKYYVLGRKNNPIILEYLDKYYDILIGMLQELSKAGYASSDINALLLKENRSFVLSGDISSMVQVLHTELIEKRSFNLKKPEVYLERLQEQLTLFLLGEHDKLITHMGEKIGDTDIRLTNHDYNPVAEVISHPGHKVAGGILGWGSISQEQWLRCYSKSFEILKQIDQGVYDELNQIIGKIVPFGTAEGCHNSCSHKTCVGHLYMGMTTDSPNPELENLEAIIHESSHNKLNLIMQSEKLILNDFEEKYYSPYRPDARHIHGVYIGIHAFVPVVYIMMKSYAEGFFGESKDALYKIALYYLKNKFTYKVLKKHGKFSPLGEEILQEVKYVMGITDKVFLSLPGYKEILATVSVRQKEHFLDVNRNYPHLEY